MVWHQAVRISWVAVVSSASSLWHAHGSRIVATTQAMGVDVCGFGFDIDGLHNVVCSLVAVGRRSSASSDLRIRHSAGVYVFAIPLDQHRGGGR